ncbi:MAG: ABC transporter permease [Lautropia sp.]|nr:ABC transporter permease [Lautropia sp.]
MAGFVKRLWALTRKEFCQMLRDRSNLGVGLALPITLILLFGYGMSFEVKAVPLAVVLEDDAAQSHGLLEAMGASGYLQPQRVNSMTDAVELMTKHQADAIVRVPMDFSRRLGQGEGRLQLVLNGLESTSAATVESYVNGSVAVWLQKQAERRNPLMTGTFMPSSSGSGSVQLIPRMWFNETGESNWFLVPGLIVMVLTLIGAFLTSLLIAREWERGTLEALFVTPAQPLEMVLAKLVPFIVVGMLDLVICLLASRLLFGVPMRGSLGLLLLGGLLYLLVSLLIGLWISGRTRNQFQASQMAMLASFLPSMMLSGFIFDLRNAPLLVQGIGHLLPATHFMDLTKSLFLMGNDAATISRDLGILVVYVLVLLWASCRTLRKTLDR